MHSTNALDGSTQHNHTAPTAYLPHTNISQDLLARFSEEVAEQEGWNDEQIDRFSTLLPQPNTS